MVCLLSRGARGDTGKLNHEETVRGPEIAIFPEKSEILLLILVKILKKSDSTHSSSKGAVNAYFLTGSFSKKTWLFEAVVLVICNFSGSYFLVKKLIFLKSCWIFIEENVNS